VYRANANASSRWLARLAPDNVKQKHPVVITWVADAPWGMWCCLRYVRDSFCRPDADAHGSDTSWDC